MADRLDNPFIITGKYISGEYFCDREAETGDLVSNIVNWRNTVLVSPRRMGKTGLIHHTFAQEQIRESYETFFIDIYDTSSLEDFVLLLSKEITSRLQSKGEKFLARFLSVVSSLRLSVSADPYTGLPTIDIAPGETVTAATTLEQVFRYLEASEKPCVVAIDEFQQIADYSDGKKVIATLRKLVQQ